MIVHAGLSLFHLINDTLAFSCKASLDYEGLSSVEKQRAKYLSFLRKQGKTMSSFVTALNVLRVLEIPIEVIVLRLKPQRKLFACLIIEALKYTSCKISFLH